MSEHNCIKELDAKLADHNGRIATGFRLSQDLSELSLTILVGTEKIDKAKRKPIPPVIATFCPFCGVDMRAKQAKDPTHD